MPAVPSPVQLLDEILVHRSTIANSSAHEAAPVLEVVCAWPVSGQYGPGTRVLYYALVATCVFARKAEWVRNACLAAVLLFPAVGALHAIVLAALHQNGAVDMDVYGAFQLCTIGVLTAPVTVRLSRTYFNNPGRDIIFLWTGLLLAGLLSLTVEFFRLDATICPPNDQATIEWSQTGKFSYGSNCSMTCGKDGPFSPLRQDAASNIYVIPAPQELTFNAATLLAAACCIPAILSLVPTWIKILEKNWEKLPGQHRPAEKREDQPISGTNGATPNHMTWIATKIQSWLMLIEIPVFFAAVLAILVKGEMNFFSEPVRYQTEPMSGVGQWAPIVGTGLAVVGSLYLLLAADMEAEENEKERPDKQQNPASVETCPRCGSYVSSDGGGSASSGCGSQSNDRQPPPTMARAATQPSPSVTVDRDTTNQSEHTVDVGGRQIVAHWLNKASKQLALKAYPPFHDSGFNARGLTDYPEVPAEWARNRDLPNLQEAYSNSQQRSRAGSFIESVNSDSLSGEGSSRTPQRMLSLPSAPIQRVVTRQRHSSTLPSRQNSFEMSSYHDRTLHGEFSDRHRSPSRERNLDQTPSIRDTSSPDMVADGPDNSPRIVVSAP